MPNGRYSDPTIDPAALARAEAALDRLSSRYLEWAERDLALLEERLAQLVSQPDSRPDLMPALFAVAHDMKGQGATFDYPLVSELTNSICRLVQATPSPDQGVVDRLGELVRALGRVIRERRSGAGDQSIRQELLFPAPPTAPEDP